MNLFHTFRSCVRSRSCRSPPVRRKASSSTKEVHSMRGLPTRRMYLVVAGCTVFGMKVAVRKRDSSGALMTLPNMFNCRSRSSLDALTCPARCITILLKTRGRTPEVCARFFGCIFFESHPDGACRWQSSKCRIDRITILTPPSCKR